jgi:hypothetical protein
MVNYTPTLTPLQPCRLVAERIDPKAETRRVVCTRDGADLDAGIALMDQYIKNRNQRGWFIWVTGWMQFTCVRYDGQRLEGEYLVVRLEAVADAAPA